MRSRLYSMATLVASLAGCHDPMDACRNDVVRRYLEPGGGYTAVVYTRDCHASGRASTHVAISREGEVFDVGHDVFFADGYQGHALTEGAALWVRPIWVGRGVVTIAYDGRAKGMQEALAPRDVTVTLRAVRPTPARPGS